MWPFTRHYSLLDSGILAGGTDWHCHVLPGVDDGIRTMKESLEVLAFHEQTGLREVWLTPHVMEDVPNEPDSLRARFEELRAAYQGPIRLHLAAENMIDNLFSDRFEAGRLLTLGDAPAGEEPHRRTARPLLLVETSYFNPPMAFEDTLEEIREKGYTPLLAHPERYVYMERRDYLRLKDAGVKFQLNLMSLAGMYGRGAAEKGARLLQQGLYDFAGSDLHRLAPWQQAISDKVLTHKQVESLQALRERMDFYARV